MPFLDEGRRRMLRSLLEPPRGVVGKIARSWSVTAIAVGLVVSLLAALTPAPSPSGSPAKVHLGHVKLAWNPFVHSPRHGPDHCNPSSAGGSGSSGGPGGGGGGGGGGSGGPGPSGGRSGNGPSNGPPNPNGQGPSTSTGEPCDAFDGDFTTAVSVFNIAGRGLTGSLNLSYDSVYAQDVADTKHTGGAAVAFGFGWTSQWTTSLDFQFDPSTNTCGVIVNQYNGTAVAFKGPASGTAGTTGYCTPPTTGGQLVPIVPDSFGQFSNPDGVADFSDGAVRNPV